MKRYLSSFVLFVSLSYVYGGCCSSGVKSEIKEDLVCKFNADVSNFMNELDVKVKDIVANPGKYGVPYVFEGEVNIANVTPYIIDREYISNSFSVDAKAKVVDNAMKLNEKKLQDGIKSLKTVKELENFFEDPKIKCFLLMKKKTYFLRNGDSLILPAFCLMRISQENLERGVKTFFFNKLIYDGIVDTVYEIYKSSIKKKYSCSEFLPSSPVNLLKYGDFIESKVKKVNGMPFMNQYNSVGFNTEWSTNIKPELENINVNFPGKYSENYAENYNIPSFDRNLSVNQSGSNNNQDYYLNNVNNNTNNNINNNINYVNNDVNNNINNNANSLEGETEDPNAIKKQIYYDIVNLLTSKDKIMKDIMEKENNRRGVCLPSVGGCIVFLYLKNNEHINIQNNSSEKKSYGNFTDLYYNLLCFGANLYFKKDDIYKLVIDEKGSYTKVFFTNFITDVVLLIGLIQYKYANYIKEVNNFIEYFFSNYEDYLHFLSEIGFTESVSGIFQSRDELIKLS